MTIVSFRYGFLQSSLMELNNFVERSEDWMLFVAQAQNVLQTEIASSFDDLMDQTW